MAHIHNVSRLRCGTALTSVVGLLVGLSSTAHAQTVTCSTALANCLSPIGGGPSPAYDVIVTTTGSVTAAGNNAFGIRVQWNGYKLGTADVTTSGAQADAIRTDAEGSYVFAHSLTVTATGSSADGINVASNYGSAADAVVYVTDYANITVTSGTAVRANNFAGAGANSVIILPNNSTIRVVGTGTATQGTSTLSSDSYGYGVYAGNRNWDMNGIGTSGALQGQNNNALGNSYVFIGSDSTISTSTRNGHAVYANKGGLVQLGDGVNVSTTGAGAYALYAATEQQGSYATNVRPGYIFLEGGATLRVTNGVGGSDGANAIVMEANGAGSIIASKAMGVPTVPWDDWTQQGGRWDKLDGLDKTATTPTSGAFDVVGIMDARNGGEISLNMSDGSSFVGATDAHLEMATPSTINLNIDGAHSKWSINASSTLSALNLSSGATLEPYRTADDIATSFVLTATSNSGVTSNGGIINLQNPGNWSGGDGVNGANVAGDVFTIKGNYTGSNGAQLKIDTYLDTDGSASDKLVIDTGTASGSTSVHVNNVGGAGALTTGNGILVVDTINGGTTASGAFTLAGPVVAGPYEYTLFRSSVDVSNPDAWFLRSTLDCSLAPNAAVCPPPPPIDPPTPPTPDTPHYRIETSLDAALPSMALLYGRNLMDTLHERVGDEEDIRGRGDLHRDGPTTGGWARVMGTGGKQQGDPLGIYGSGPQFSYGFVGLQTGQDLIRREHEDGSRDHAGVTFAVGSAHGDVTHFDGTRGDDNLQAYTLGAYWTHFGAPGWYVDTMLQGTLYNARTTANRGLLPFKTNGDGIAGSVEVGKPFKFADGYFIEPQAQLIYQAINFNNAVDNAALVKFSNVDSLIGRIGARLGRTWSLDGNGPAARLITAWIRPNVWQEFRGNPVTQFSSEDGFIPFRADLGGTWGEVNVGVSGQVNLNTTLFADASYQSRFDGGGFAYNGKAGVRINW